METITIDNEDVVIAKLPADIQNQIALFEHITHKVIDARKDLATVELARGAASAQIAQMYHKYKAAKAEAAAANVENAEESAD